MVVDTEYMISADCSVDYLLVVM